MLQHPATMRCIDVAEPGDPDVLAVVTKPVPRPAAGEVLLRVTAAGINHADLMQRRGQYPPPAGSSTTLGMEVSGHIAEVGAEVERWMVGDAVCALISGGGYAEYCVAPAGQCMPVPPGVALCDAAAIPEAALTVWANLFQPSRLFAGDRFLVQGGSSGIGTMAIQIARCFGARVVTTAGSDEKCTFCLGLGAEKAINYRSQDWATEAASWAEPHGVDTILDMIGGDYLPKHLQLLATGGRLVHIAYAHGGQVTIDLRTVMSKRLLITGSTLRPRTVKEKSSLARAVEHNLWPLFAAGRLRPIIDSTFSLQRAADAHRRIESSEHIGKLLLAIA